MEKTIEEQFNNDLHWMLSELKQEEIANRYSEYQVKFFIEQNSKLEPSEKSQHRIIKMLSDKKALKLSPIYHRMEILSTPLGMQGARPIGYYINFLQPTFDKTIEETIGESIPPLERSLPEAKTPILRDNTQGEYSISLEGRKVVLNNTFLITTTNFFGDNDYFMEFIINHPDEKITKEKIEKNINLELSNDFHKILNSLGFTGEIRKTFFKVSKNTLQFTNNVRIKDLKSRDVNLDKLNSEISRLKRVNDKKSKESKS